MATVNKHSQLVFAILSVLAVSASAQENNKPAQSALRGIATDITIRSSERGIRAIAQQTRESPVLVRISDKKMLDDGSFEYHVQFIGLFEGTFDLRDFLEANGAPVPGIQPMPIEVVSQLAGAKGTDLFTDPDAPKLTPSGYQRLAITLAIVWVSIPIIYLVIRQLKKTPPPAIIEQVKGPTLADQLYPLVASAVAGSLTIKERGALELLLYRYWRERLHLPGPLGRVVSSLRHHDEAGELLNAVERWLHSDREATTEENEEVTKLLEPYKSIPAISLIGADSPESEEVAV